MDNDFKYGIIVIVILALAYFIFSSVFVRKSDIRDLMEEKLIDHFSTVSNYLDGDEEISCKEAQDAFDAIKHELDKLY